MKLNLIALAYVLGSLIVVAAPQQPPSPLNPISLVPLPIQPVARQFLDRSQPEATRLDLLEQIVEEKPATSLFLLRVLADEPSVEVRKMLIGALDFQTTAGAAAAVAERAQNDSDPGVRDVALARLQWEQAAALNRGTRNLRDLATAARTAGAPAEMLEAEAARRDALVTKTSGLPDPPPVFSATDALPVRIVVLGDFGTKDHGSADVQERVAARMAALHKTNPFTIGISVGDNFYSMGLSNTKDDRWDLDWERPYSSLGIPFYVVPGNHDWLGTTKAIKAEIAYTDVSPSKSWRMPAAYYTFTAGPIQFFALDTDGMHDGSKDDQLDWFQTEAAKSTSPWRIAFGHHPFLTGGQGHGMAQFGGEDDEIRTLREKVLLPVLRNRVDLFVSGHDHELQLLDMKGLLEIVSGGGGRESDKVVKLAESLFCAQSFGFTVLEATPQQLAIRFVRLADPAGTFSYSCIIEKGADGKITHACQTRCPL